MYIYSYERSSNNNNLPVPGHCAWARSFWRAAWFAWRVRSQVVDIAGSCGVASSSYCGAARGTRPGRAHARPAMCTTQTRTRLTPKTKRKL